MAFELEFSVERALDLEHRLDLEQRLGRRLGLVACVRHPPAIDDVRVIGDDQTSSVLVSACCELTSRRAKIVVREVMNEPSTIVPELQTT